MRLYYENMYTHSISEYVSLSQTKVFKRSSEDSNKGAATATRSPNIGQSPMQYVMPTSVVSGKTDTCTNEEEDADDANFTHKCGQKALPKKQNASCE